LILDFQKQRIINNNGATGRAAYVLQKRTNDDMVLDLQQHSDALGNGAQ
jgi:hypothetical protein